ncbi:MAG TPA: PorV/PorQ family protein [bacterium]|nr:PorV/PorQ family protein [bacterium]
MRRLFIILAAAVWGCNIYASAGSYGADSVFGAGTGSRSLSMGSAFTAVADDSSAVYYNPAGLMLLEKQEISVLHYPLYEDTLYNSMTYGQPILDFGAIGAAIYRLSTGDIGVYSADNFEGGTINFEEYKATLSYASGITQNLFYGINVNIFTMSLGSVNAVGFGADAGILYQPFDFLRLGVMAHNLVNPSLAMRDEKEDLPRSITAGVLFKASFKPVDAGLAIDASAAEEAGARIRAGIEAVFFNTVSLRAGYDDGLLGFGAGLSASGIAFDYAMLLNEYMGPLSRFTLSYRFGLTLEQQAEEKEKALREQVQRMIEAEFKKREQARAGEYYEKAKTLAAQKKYEQALAELDLAFEWYEAHAGAKNLKGEIEAALIGRYYNEGAAKFRQADYVSALELFRRTAAINRNYKETQLYITRINNALKMKSGARDIFNSGVEHYANRRYDRAVEDFTRALKIEPKNETIRTYLARARTQLSRASGGASLAPAQAEKVNSLYYSGLRSYTAGALEEAVKQWKEALAINPSDIRVLKAIEKAQAELAELKRRGIK